MPAMRSRASFIVSMGAVDMQRGETQATERQFSSSQEGRVITGGSESLYRRVHRSLSVWVCASTGMR